MALYTKAEFARETGVSTAYMTMMCKRGKVITTDDGSVDSNNPLNLAFTEKQKQLASKRPLNQSEPISQAKQEKQGTIEKAVKSPAKKKEDSGPKDARARAFNEKLERKFEMELEEKGTKARKMEREIKLLQMKEEKISGKLIPTDLVKNTVRQLTQSIMVSFNDAVDALLIDISKSAKMDRTKVADLRRRLKQIVNEAINRSVDHARENINNIVQEHSQDKKAA